MKKLLLLLIVLLLIPCPAKAEKYWITIELTDKEGIVLLTDKEGTREMPYYFETDEIEFYAYPYSLEHSLAGAKIQICSKDLMMNVDLDIKEEYHNENWFYSIENTDNGAYLEDKICKCNQFYLPLSEGRNHFDFSAWIMGGDYQLFRIDMMNIVYLKLK